MPRHPAYPLAMSFDTQPGNLPVPITHSVRNCACGHDEESHEAVETSFGGERTALVVCLECDAAEV